MLVYTTKMRNMSIEEWIKEREQRGHMTFYVSEIPQFHPEQAFEMVKSTFIDRMSGRRD
jgi:hypothetical protein